MIHVESFRQAFARWWEATGDMERRYFATIARRVARWERQGVTRQERARAELERSGRESNVRGLRGARYGPLSDARGFDSERSLVEAGLGG